MKTTALHWPLILLLIIICSSCNQNHISQKNTKVQATINQLKIEGEASPKVVLAKTDSILRSNSKKLLDENTLLMLYQIRQKAFSNLKNADSVCVTGEKIRITASLLSDSLAIAESLIAIPKNADFKYFKKLEVYLPAAIKTFDRLNKKYESAILRVLNGTILCKNGDYVKAQAFYLSALTTYKSLDSLPAIGKTCISLGNNYAYIGSMKESFLYYRLAVDIGKKSKNSELQANALMNIGINYRKIIPDSALIYYNKSRLALSLTTKNLLKIKLNYNIANLYFDRGNYILAEKVFQKMSETAISENNFESIAMAYSGLASVFNKTGKHLKAVAYMKRSITLADSLGMENVSLMLRPELISIYKNSGDYKNALSASEQMKSLNDSLMSIEKQVAVHELDQKYQSEKKTQEIVHLQKVVSLRQKIILTLVSIAALLAFLFYKQYKLRKEKTIAYTVLMKKYREEKENREQATQIQEIDSKEQQHEISEDTLLYAKLVAYYEQEKPFLDSNLKAEQVSKQFQIPQRKLTAILKTHAFSNFANFTNQYRVDEVKKLFENTENTRYKMDVLYIRSGFGSRQSFYTAFEQFTGVNPGFYRSEILKIGTIASN